MTILGIDGKMRCFGGTKDSLEYGNYHDHEWGKPVYDDHKLFEILILECMQSGLNFETILKKRQGYLDLFYNLNPHVCSKLSDDYLLETLTNPNIIRHRLKVFAIRQNAIAFLKIQKEHQTFSSFIWNYVNHTVERHNVDSFQHLSTSSISIEISKELKKWGMKFIGTTTVYAFMQAAGLVNDHLKGCFLSDCFLKP